MKKIHYCKRCVYPTSTVNLHVDEEGICSSCRTAESFDALTEEFWINRKEKFESLIHPYVNSDNSNYDCLIPVSGGKDSYYQTHLMAKE